MKTLGYFGFYIFTVFCGIRIDLIVFGGMRSSSWRRTNIKYDMFVGYIDKQVAILLSGEIIFLSSVPELRDDKASVTSEAKLDKHSTGNKTFFRFKSTPYNCFKNAGMKK